MKFTTSILLAVQALSVLAIPQNRAARPSAAAPAASSAAAVAAPAAPAAGAAEENKENEVEQPGQFGQVIALGGGNIKTDTIFPPGVNGGFEVEFQNDAARQLRVTEVANPPAPPAGFTALEPVAYKVEVGGGTAGLTLQKIDYILTAGNALDISQGKIGKLCTETGSFVIDDAIGELEFEVEENELTLTVNSLTGTWGIFVPQAAGAAAGAGAGAGAGAAAGNATAGAGAGAAKEGAAAGGAKAGPAAGGAKAGAAAGGAKAGAAAGGAAGGAAAGGAAGGAANNAEIKKLLEQLVQLVGA
ncbi:hypothetical protein B0T18DRAFT_436796 [Schizothecium vesticola]|uniref:Accumulation-associated protein n=1 Tax=Schizothecium vesticola TaxID=314040 RepID=A0AA40K7U0_9PEZI|nr:hypothetical protein B0T18DRAFT_436796 [Schizothecium vesticola]